MTPQIKQRIEQIRRGEVPEGYKKTKVGIVPNEWELYKLCEISEELHECAGDATYETLSISAGMGFVNQANKFGKEISGAQYSKYTVLKKGDFSYNKGNSKKYPQGCIYQLKDREAAAVPNVFESFRLTKGNNDFFEQLFMHGFLNSQLFSKINHGVRDDGLLNLRGNDFYSSYVLFPPLPEQEKIAEILSAQDKLIALKEKLIEEKKRQKKALMQQLLTGKKRLPGFCGEWTASKIKDVTEISAGATPNTNNPEFWGGNIKWMNSGELNNKHIFDVIGRITETGLSKTSTKLLPQKCVLIGLAGQGKTRGTVAINYIELCTNQSIAAVHPCDVWIPEFIYYSLDMRYDELRMISSGDGTRGGLNLKLIGDLIVKYPSYEEQEAIANVLSIADKEIAFLQKNLDQEKQKKKALMQLLLTGIVRV